MKMYEMTCRACSGVFRYPCQKGARRKSCEACVPALYTRRPPPTHCSDCGGEINRDSKSAGGHPKLCELCVTQWGTAKYMNLRGWYRQKMKEQNGVCAICGVWTPTAKRSRSTIATLKTHREGCCVMGATRAWGCLEMIPINF